VCLTLKQSGCPVDVPSADDLADLVECLTTSGSGPKAEV
jgi:hypothetical protein